MVEFVLLNVGVLCFVLVIWAACGIGPILLLAPKTRFITWLLLSPLIGLMLIVSLGDARLEFILAPVDPIVDCCLLAGVGLAVLYLRRNIIRHRLRKCCRFLFRLSGPYLAFIVLFSLVFGSSGFELLSTGSDELAYGMIEQQIIQNMHRGTPGDSPIMRLDHYVQDYPARDIVYLKNYRRGPDILTVTTAMLLGFSPQRVYPVTFGCLTLALALAVLFLCRNGFGMKLSLVWPVPLFFLLSAGLWTLHIQGNFSNLSSWALFLLTPWFLMQALERVRLRWIFPLALMIASVYSLYYEPTVLSLVVPCCLVTLYCIIWRRTSITKLVSVAAILSGLALLFDPRLPNKLALSLLIAQKYPDLPGLLRGSVGRSSVGITTSLGRILPAWWSLAHSDWWPHVANVLFGISSSIDVSRLNLLLRSGVASVAPLSLLGIYFTIAVACFGLLAGSGPLGVFLSIVMVMWFAATHVFAVQRNFLTFYRGGMYALPFLLLGLGLACCHARRIFSKSPSPLRYLTIVPLFASIAFLFMNAFTSAALGGYVHSHSICDDAWIKRLNPDAVIWDNLRQTLAESRAPIMISGFTEPPRVLWLASGITPTAHFMGKSTSDHWLFGVHARPDEPFYPTQVPTPQRDWVKEGFGGGDREGWYIKGPSAALMPIVAKQNIPWSHVYPRFLSESQIALVPIGYGWPSEWDDRGDIFGSMTIEFSNIADVVYRHRNALSVSAAGLGPLSSDVNGRYRELAAKTVITAQSRLGWAEVSILFSGTPDDLALTGLPLDRVDQNYISNSETKSFFRLREPAESVDLTLTGNRGVRIRDISMRVIPATLGCSPAFEP